jgi:hypothetical protein
VRAPSCARKSGPSAFGSLSIMAWTNAASSVSARSIRSASPADRSSLAAAAMGCGDAPVSGATSSPPERSDEEHACAAEPAREVEEELHRSGIDPLQVVEEDEKAAVLRQVAEEGRELLEERQPEVVSGRRSACGALCQGGEPREALGAHAGVPMGEAMERAGRDEASEQRWGTIEKGIDGVGQAAPRTQRLLLPRPPGLGWRLGSPHSMRATCRNGSNGFPWPVRAVP